MTSKSHWVYLSLIILLGFSLRLAGVYWGQSFCYFAYGDEIEAYQVAVDYGLGMEKAHYIGQPNFNDVSKLPGPLWTMFWFYSMRFGGSADAVAGVMILLNTAVIYLVYLLAKRIFGSQYSLWAALFAATQPWAVYYSVGAYNPEVMAFLGGLTFLALWDVTQRDCSPHVFWVCFILMIMLQFHMSGLTLIPAVLIVLFLSRTRVSKVWLAAGLLTGALMYLPYVQGDMADGWKNTVGMLTGERRFSFSFLKALITPLSLVMSWGPRWTGRHFTDYLDMGNACFGSFVVMFFFKVLSSIVACFFVVGFISEVRAAMRGHWRSPREAFEHFPGVLFTAILLIVPLLCFIMIGKGYSSRYGIVQFPLFLLLPALFVVRRIPKFKQANLLLSGVVVTIIFNVFLMSAFYHYQGRLIKRGDHFIPSFAQLNTVYQLLKAHAGKNQQLRIDDADYLSGVDRRDPRYNARAISEYVIVREQQAAIAGSGTLPAQVYVLRRAGEAVYEPGRVGYRGHGIVLVARK